ncbi:MAG: hypothetical protein NDJ90_13915 [Oligoflexia bacterium]|nr:hypothetical protein [Oligoflexia bacterium]
MDALNLKSIWKAKGDRGWSFYCPLCRATRKIACQPKPTHRHYLQVGLTSLVVMLALWPWISWKGIVSFLPLWIGFELVYRSRVRVALNCPHCGFDPYLYLVDARKAREEIEAHWRKKFAEKGVPFPEKDRPAAVRAKAGAPAPVAMAPTAESPSAPEEQIEAP